MCPYVRIGMSASYNKKPEKLGVTLTNVTFSQFICSVAQMVFYKEGKNDLRMGAPLKEKDMPIVDSNLQAQLTFLCN